MSAIAPVRLGWISWRVAVPGALIVALYGIAILLALAAPGRGDDGQVYAVSVNAGQDDWVYIPRASLECARDGQESTCAVDVVGRPLSVVMTFGADESREIRCAEATYDGKAIRCEATYAYTAEGVGAVAVLPEGLDLTAEQARGIADSRPWWADPGNVTDLVPFVVAGLAAVAALVVGFGGVKPVDNGRVWVVATGVGWLVVVLTGCWMLGDLHLVLALPVLFFIGPPLVYWQYLLTQPARAPAILRAAGALAMTALASSAALFVFQLSGAYID
ncbi:hypothetical protein [Actinokineospora cianjurensis]|uniref:Uncharacterized protein n=1 Tax=Actinokineospora cianjurensis TaxID=585224 RepID=A0A421B9S8_9PSEU|nr:hypothetical protein [Actinokineospora cianjurensis]RLK61035.1 hypothetical protein CLV68_1550 [Actinokineospora cianjurensis]